MISLKATKIMHPNIQTKCPCQDMVIVKKELSSIIWHHSRGQKDLVQRKSISGSYSNHANICYPLLKFQKNEFHLHAILFLILGTLQNGCSHLAQTKSSHELQSLHEIFSTPTRICNSYTY